MKIIQKEPYQQQPAVPQSPHFPLNQQGEMITEEKIDKNSALALFKADRLIIFLYYIF